MKRILSAQGVVTVIQWKFIQGPLNSAMCYYQLRQTHGTLATARGPMTVVFKAVFTKSEAQDAEHPQEKRVVLTIPTEKQENNRTFIPVKSLKTLNF